MEEVSTAWPFSVTSAGMQREDFLDDGRDREEPVEPEDALKNSEEISSAPNISPNFSQRVYRKKGKRRGRQRAKDRNTADDGTRQLFELWWEEGAKGQSFSAFFRSDLSEDMRAYYPREYINESTRNPKSWSQYQQWRREWLSKRREGGKKFGENSGDPEISPGTSGPKIIPIRKRG